MSRSNVKRILLDVDGVLADWTGAVARLYGVRHVDWSEHTNMALALGVTEEDMWGRVDAQGEGFWEGLDIYPWAHDLLERARKRAPTTLLTSPSHHPSSLSGKVLWMNRHFGEPFRDFLIGPRKEACAADGHWLIDDRASMCTKFVQAGGHAVVFPQPWNGAWDVYKHHRMDALADLL